MTPIVLEGFVNTAFRVLISTNWHKMQLTNGVFSYKVEKLNISSFQVLLQVSTGGNGFLQVDFKFWENEMACRVSSGLPIEPDQRKWQVNTMPLERVAQSGSLAPKDGDSCGVRLQSLELRPFLWRTAQKDEVCGPAY